MASRGAAIAAVLVAAACVRADPTHVLRAVQYNFQAPTYDPSFDMVNTYSFDLVALTPGDDWNASQVFAADTMGGAVFYQHPANNSRDGYPPEFPWSGFVGVAPPVPFNGGREIAHDDLAADSFLFAPGTPPEYRPITAVYSESATHIEGVWMDYPPATAGTPALLARFTIVVPAGITPTLVPRGHALLVIDGASVTQAGAGTVFPFVLAVYDGGDGPGEPPGGGSGGNPGGGAPLPISDDDADGVPQAVDNCPDTYNPDQADRDGDGVGDSCDGCPDDPNKSDPGECGCGVPGDGDSDVDGAPDCVDNCPLFYNPDQTDSDGDGYGDACDGSPDGAITEPAAGDGVDQATLSTPDDDANRTTGPADAASSLAEEVAPIRMPGLCGFGFAAMLPWMLLGMGCLKRRAVGLR